MANEIQRITQNSSAPIYGDFTLTFDGQTTSALSYTFNTTDMDNALEALSNIGSGNITVTTPFAGVWDIEFIGAMADQNQPLISMNFSNLYLAANNPTLENTQTGAAPVINSTTINSNFQDGDESNPAVVTLTFSPIPNQGTWNTGVAVINYNDPISSHPAGWTGAGTASSGTVTFTATSNGSTSPYTGYSNVDLAEFASAGQPQIFTLTTSNNATAGQILLTLTSNNANFAYNASLSTVQSAMAIGGISDYTASGPDGGPWVFTGTSNFSVNLGYGVTSYGSDPLRVANSDYTISEFQQGFIPSFGTASGDSTASAVGQSTIVTTGTAPGDSTASATSAATKATTGTAPGDSTASATSAATKATTGTASGDSTASATSAATKLATGTASGDSTASAVGQSTIVTTGTAPGDSTASATSAATKLATGTTPGDSAASAVGAALTTVIGSGSGTSTTSSSHNQLTGSVVGEATISGITSAAIKPVDGSAPGDSAASTVGITAKQAVGTASGEALMSGDGLDYFYYEVVDNPLLFAGTATTSVTFNFSLPLSWNNQTLLEWEKPFKWNVGELPMRWYRIEGTCNYARSTSEQVGACDVIPLATNDAGCQGSSAKLSFIQNVAGRNLSEVCAYLQENKWTWPIRSIKRFTRPADNRFVEANDNCNELEVVEYCDVPECFNFCLHTDALVEIRARTTYTTNALHYEASGGLSLGGSAETEIDGSGDYGPDFSYQGSGGLSLGGSAETEIIWDLGYEVNMVATVAIDSVEMSYAPQDDVTEVTASTETVNTNCVNCTEMPQILELTHNLEETAVLREFCSRNGLILPSIIPLHYSYRSDSWQGTLHYSGLADYNQPQQEMWRLVFEWACVDTVAAEELNSHLWKFSLSVLRKNLVTGEDFDTRLLILFPSEEMCSDTESLGFNFSFDFNTQKKFVVTNLDNIVDVRLLYDNIGLFRSATWVENPLLSIGLADVASINSFETQDIKPIFPQEPVFFSI